MARQTIPAHVLASRGREIKFIDGTTAQLVFTFSSIMTLEESFGSIGAAVNEMKKLGDGAAFGSIVKILAAGLEHEVNADGVPLSTVSLLRHMLDPTQIETYAEQMGSAFEAAFPAADPDEKSDDADPTKPTDSRGPIGTTSAQSSSDAATQNSGA